MKHYIGKSICSLVALCAMGGCQELKFGDEFLEKAPGSEVNIDVIYSNSTYAYRALWAAYQTIPYGLSAAGDDKMMHDMLECLTDLNHSGLGWTGCGSQLYYSGSVDADIENTSSATKYSYTKDKCWVGIRRAWLFIENVDRVPDMTDDEKKKLKAEAKVIIAIHYIDLFRHFGGVPWIDRSLTPTTVSKVPRSTALETLNNIVTLLDEAAADLPWALTSSEIPEWDGRLTAAAAMGLKARVLLFAASPLFNSATPYLDGEASSKQLTWMGGYDPNLWERAYEAHKAFFDRLEKEGGYALVQANGELDYRKAWRRGYLDRGTGETIISVRISNGYSKLGYFWDDKNYYFMQAAGDYGTASPTQELVNMFGMTNGKAIDDPGSGYDDQNPYENRDPRLYETVVVNGKDYYNRIAEIYPGGKDYQDPRGSYGCWKTGYRLRKFLLDGGGAVQYEEPCELQGKELHWPLLRLSELYLGYAEAIFQSGRGVAAAAPYINEVRRRVGVEPIYGLNDANFIDKILTERACELAFEEVRWYDIIRYKREDIFKKKLHIVEIVKNPDGSFTYSYNDLPAPDRYWATNFSPKWYLSAFPSDEVRKMGGTLIQNPGW